MDLDIFHRDVMKLAEDCVFQAEAEVHDETEENANKLDMGTQTVLLTDIDRRCKQSQTSYTYSDPTTPTATKGIQTDLRESGRQYSQSSISDDTANGLESVSLDTSKSARSGLDETDSTCKEYKSFVNGAKKDSVLRRALRQLQNINGRKLFYRIIWCGVPRRVLIGEGN